MSRAADLRSGSGSLRPGRGRRSRPAVIAATVGIALVVNLIGYASGRAAGGRYEFVRGGRTMEVDAATVAGFTVVPLLVGLVLVAVVAPRWPVVHRIALVGAPLLAVGTIGAMTIPAGFDTASTVALASCHLTLVPISVAGLLALAPRGR